MPNLSCIKMWQSVVLPFGLTEFGIRIACIWRESMMRHCRYIASMLSIESRLVNLFKKYDQNQVNLYLIGTWLKDMELLHHRHHSGFYILPGKFSSWKQIGSAKIITVASQLHYLSNVFLILYKDRKNQRSPEYCAKRSRIKSNTLQIL